MEGLFANLYLVLQQKLMSIYVDPTADPLVPVLNFAGQDTGQLKDEQPAMSYPGTLINFDDMHMEAIGNNCQIGHVNIRLKLATIPASGTGNSAPVSVKEKGLSSMRIETLIHNALQGWSPSDENVPVNGPEPQPDGWSDIFGSLDRVTVETNKERDDLKIRELVYSLSIDDYSTYNIQTAPVNGIDITDELDIPIP